MDKLTQQLEDLLASGTISCYRIQNLDSDGVPTDEPVGGRNTECLILKFPNGKELKIGTFCSGCLENTCFIAVEE